MASKIKIAEFIEKYEATKDKAEKEKLVKSIQNKDEVSYAEAIGITSHFKEKYEEVLSGKITMMEFLVVLEMLLTSRFTTLEDVMDGGEFLKLCDVGLVDPALEINLLVIDDADAKFRDMWDVTKPIIEKAYLYQSQRDNEAITSVLSDILDLLKEITNVIISKYEVDIDRIKAETEVIKSMEKKDVKKLLGAIGANAKTLEEQSKIIKSNGI